MDNSNPATLFLGTTWEKQEGRFLLGSSSSYVIGSTGGSATTTLTKANLPATKLQLDSFSLGRGTQEITGQVSWTSGIEGLGTSGAFTATTSTSEWNGHSTNWRPSNVKLTFAASRTWTGMSTSAAPFTTNMGNGTAFNNIPPYLAVNIWKRLS